nr:MAG TPA: protein of unknown function (DUF4926) [Caudoviricetes sp.]
MIEKKYKTIYPSIVPKGWVGTCVAIEDGVVLAFRLEFENGESFWFMKRDLKEVAE